ncbi:carbohydrate ABC transporter substrate-binding protein (CUT1 family) [Microbacterium sp. AG1240]|uniref:extracellular solute-binding protein n=1 Tax=Microbacterium sp. AG1240 TaxID=2183992 RepID=UPI000EAEF9B2|nr:extracellular solute-binding protein [Microbacterium sp. AG1240]RKT31624.1 carbohydrate ABC transporter substrate-binding protein (CUT1 family) [Microbacterium sp. AG1240]
MRTPRITAAIASVAVAALAFTACASADAGSGPESADLTVWFMRGDVSDEAQQWLVDEWATQHDGAELTIEIQDWDGIVTKLQTSLSSPQQTPDVVELGNTQVLAFAAAGALTDISDMTEEIGGDDLIPSLVDTGSYEDALYAAPLFAGSRIVFYRESLLEAAGIEVPETLPELTAAAAALQAANPAGTTDFEGFYMPAPDWGAATGWFFTNGSNYAEQNEDGTWKGTLSSPEGQAAMAELQEMYETGGLTAATSTTQDYQQAYAVFNEGRAGMFTSLSLTWDKIDPAIQEDTGVMVLPGLEAGTPGATLAGGSNIAISKNSANQENSRELIRMIMGEEFQTLFAKAGWVPGNQAYGAPLAETAVGAAELEAVAAAQATPLAENWAVVESNDVIRELLVRVAKGEDIEALGAEFDGKIESLLNG